MPDGYSKGFVFKVVLIGAGAVGKTSLVQRFVNDRFQTNYSMTMGVDFLVKNVDFEADKFAKLAIWDIGGQDRFQFLRNTFYDGANGALLIFDLSRVETYIEIKKWLDELRSFTGDEIPFLLIGNKLDLVEEIGEVTERAEAAEFAKNEQSIYIETSAKTGVRVEDAFVNLTRLIAGKYLD